MPGPQCGWMGAFLPGWKGLDFPLSCLSTWALTRLSGTRLHGVGWGGGPFDARKKWPRTSRGQAARSVFSHDSFCCFLLPLRFCRIDLPPGWGPVFFFFWPHGALGYAPARHVLGQVRKCAAFECNIYQVTCSRALCTNRATDTTGGPCVL
jgi:hypothetical protein